MLDLKEDEKKWIKYNKLLPQKIQIAAPVVGNDYIYFIYSKYQIYKIKKLDFIPTDIHKGYSLLFRNLIEGYRKDTHNKNIALPLVLIKIIIKYYNGFQ